MNTYFIKTFGCQANKSDSERIEGDYQARGYRPVRSWKKADEIVVNTCAVRQRAEDRAKGFLLNVVKHFEQIGALRPKVILTGCMTHHGKEKLFKMLPMVDEILPVGEVGFNSKVVRKDKLHGWVPISTGCNSFCTFCIVPYSRGREKSRSMKDILSEVQKLAQEGYKEVTLLGMNVNSWGLDKDRKFIRDDLPTNQSQYLKAKGIPPFVRLLKKISQIEGIEKIRFITSNPWDFHDELIDEIARNTKIDRFIHLPVQSGSNKVLKLMNRGYTREDYLYLIKKLRKKVVNVVLGTDIIVGFPGETEADFRKTVDLAKEVNWKVAFVAQYSPRPGTAAWRIYNDEVSPLEKKRRWQILDDLINKPHLDDRKYLVK